MFSRISGFFKRDIWRMPAKSLNGPRGLCIRALRIFLVSFREFTSDQCALRASALTFYSLLSIVPVFAMAFGIAKGFGLDKVLREKLMESAGGQQEIFSRILEFSDNFLQNTKGGVIAGIGLALLFWTIIQVLSSIEDAFNHIWGIRKQRSMSQKFADYLAFMLVAPVVFIIASSATVFVVSQIKLITEKIAILGVFGPVIFLALKVLPTIMFAFLLTYLYMFMPNGKIQFRSALIGGVVAGLIYQSVQWVYIRFQIGASGAGAIYGTFAALPLFLTWLQLSWRIVLYGAELSFSHQYDSRFEFVEECMSASTRLRRLLSLHIMQFCVKRFSAGLEPVSDEQISDQLEIPLRLTRELLQDLSEAHLLLLVQSKSEKERFYQPARSVEGMTVQFVLQQLDNAGTDDIPLPQSPELLKIRESFQAFETVLEDLPANYLLKDLSSRAAKAAV